MNERAEAVPAPADDASPSLATCEGDKAPPTASEGEGKGALPVVASSGAGAWNTALLNGILQVAAGAELHGDDPSAALPRVRAAVEAMTGIGPDDVIADMCATQLIAAHTLAMDCYRRAAGGGELEVWRESLNQANRLSRTWAALAEALNRHRGKSGQQTVRVEHVTVNDGGQAIVGAVEQPGGRGR